MNPVLINGINYAWGDIQFVLFGNPVIGITEIEYSSKQEKTNNYGAGYQPTSRGRKNISYSGSISLYIDEIRAILATAPGSSILNISPFSITVIASGTGLTNLTDTLRNVEFTEDNFSSKQNDSNIVVKVPFIYAGLEHS